METYVVEWFERVKVRAVVVAEDAQQAIEAALDTDDDDRYTEYHDTDEDSIEVSLFDEED